MSVKALEYSYNLSHLHKVETRVSQLFNKKNHWVGWVGFFFFNLFFRVTQVINIKKLVVGIISIHLWVLWALISRQMSSDKSD